MTALILLLSGLAFADSLDKLGAALLHDRSYRVRAQAAIVLGKLKDRRGVPLLIKALNDKEEAVRAIAVASLGKLRDPEALEGLAALLNDPSPLVQSAVGKAIGAIEGSPDEGAPPAIEQPAGPRRFALEVSPAVANQGSPEMAKFVHDELVAKLANLSDVTLKPEPDVPSFFVDTSITKLDVSGSAEPRGHVKVDCNISVIVASYPEHSIKMMATLGASVEEENVAGGAAEAQRDCLGEMANLAMGKVQTYLKGVR